MSDPGPSDLLRLLAGPGPRRRGPNGVCVSVRPFVTVWQWQTDVLLLQAYCPQGYIIYDIVYVLAQERLLSLLVRL